MQTEHMGKKGAGEKHKVQVMVRVRPFVSRELDGLDVADYPVSIVQMDERKVLVEGKEFVFHKTFWSIPEEQRQPFPTPFASNEDVFDVVGLPCVEHALTGKHSCIFAYGQTGSGKTHTMLGSESLPGVAPQVVDRLFSRLEQDSADADGAGGRKRARSGFRHTVEISFMEIYNEKVMDLFGGVPCPRGASVAGGELSSASVRRAPQRRGSLDDHRTPRVPGVGSGYESPSRRRQLSGLPAGSTLLPPGSASPPSAQQPRRGKGARRASYLPQSASSPESPRRARPGSVLQAKGGRRSGGGDGDSPSRQSRQSPSRQGRQSPGTKDGRRSPQRRRGAARRLSVEGSKESPMHAHSSAPVEWRELREPSVTSITSENVDGIDAADRKPQPQNRLSVPGVQSANSCDLLVVPPWHGGGSIAGCSSDSFDGASRSQDMSSSARRASPKGRRRRRGSAQLAASYSVAAGDDYRDLRVRQSPQQGTFVEGLRRLGPQDGVDTAEAVKRHMRGGMAHRATAATQMNATSSRSHAIFQICIKSHDLLKGVQRYAHVNIVDLAGSERNKQSQAEGERLYEATRINLSLSTLRRVIDALLENSQKKKGHPPVVVPYRDSTLTHILSDSLGGNSRTVMLATVSPAESNREDTLNTLNYAHKAKDIVNTVFVNEQKTEVVLSFMQKELAQLRSRLHEANEGGDEDAELREELRNKEAEFEDAQFDVQRIEEEVRRDEEAVAQVQMKQRAVGAEVELLRSQGVEEDFAEVSFKVEHTSDAVQLALQEITQKHEHLKRAEAKVEVEQKAVTQIAKRKEKWMSREQAYADAVAIMDRKERAHDTLHSYRRNKAHDDRTRIESQLGMTRDAQSRGQLEIQRLEAQRRPLQWQCEQLRSQRIPATERQAAELEGAAQQREDTLRAEVRELTVIRQTLEPNVAKRHQEALSIDAAACKARDERLKAAAEWLEKVRMARLRAVGAQKELEQKRRLGEQLQTQARVLREERDELRRLNVRLEERAERSRSATAAFRRESEAARALAAQLRAKEVEYGRYRRLRGTEIERLGEEKRQEMEGAMGWHRKHEELKEYASWRYFPTATAAQRDESPTKSPLGSPRGNSPRGNSPRQGSKSPMRAELPVHNRSPVRQCSASPRPPPRLQTAAVAR